MTASSPIRAAQLKPRPSPKLTPFVVHRHDMWASPSPGAPTTRRYIERTAFPVQQAATEVSSSSLPWWQLLAQIAGWPVRMIALAWRLQGEIRDLNVLDDHLLEDMGVTRAELRAALRKGAHPQPERPVARGAYGHP